jgi:glucokinase
MYILAGDIGAKESNFALFTHKIDAGKRTIDSLVTIQTFSCEDYEKYGLSDKPEKNGIVPSMIKAFRAQHREKTIYGACLGISAPIISGKVKIDHPGGLKTIFTKADICEALPYKNLPVSLLNDMEAIGYGIFLGNGEDKLEELSSETEQTDPKARRALMLVAEGLGKVCWYWNEKKEALCPLSSEGGHADFASPGKDEDDLLKMLREEKEQNNAQSPVSSENVLSKTGLEKIYQFMKENRKYRNESLELSQYIEKSNKKASLIIEKALQQNDPDPMCNDALDMFLSIWGAEAGNLALWFNARGGVYIGGITIPIERLKKSEFIKAFNKRASHISDEGQIPVKVFSMEENIVLWGAARFAIDNAFVTRGEAAIAAMEQ